MMIIITIARQFIRLRRATGVTTEAPNNVQTRFSRTLVVRNGRKSGTGSFDRNTRKQLHDWRSRVYAVFLYRLKWRASSKRL